MSADDTKAEPTEFEEVLVDHAVRCWNAECENANRLSSRSTLLLSALAALFGLGLFRIDWFRGEKDVSRINSHLAIYSIKALIASALVTFAFSFWKVMGRRKEITPKDKPHSADLMSLPESIITKGPPVGADARKLVFIRVYRAYVDLQGRNAIRKAALNAAQQWFLVGFALIGAAILLYIVFGEPPTI